MNIGTLNSRCVQVLLYLLNLNKPVTINSLGERYKVSNRTIRYDLDIIDEFLRDNGFKLLIRKPNCGIMFMKDSAEKRRVIDFITNLNTYYIVLSKEDRASLILNELISQQDYITIISIADELCVSRNTIIKDLKRVKKWLEEYDLSIKSVPKHGIKITGEEKNLRRAQIKLLTENNGMIKSLSELKTKPIRNTKSSSSLKSFFDDIDIQYIEECINVAERELDTIFSDEAFVGLAIHIALAIKRIKAKKEITMNKDELKSLELTKEFAVASNITRMLEQRFNITISTDEIGYITIHLLGSNRASSKVTESENWVELQILANNVIQRVSTIVGEDLTGDRQLYNGLLEHLKPTIYRLNHDLTLKNPILDEIRSRFNELFKAVKIGLKPVEDFTGKRISDEEVGYFAMHFGAAIERIKNASTTKMNVLVVCATGMGTAEMLSSRIQSVFNVNIVGTVARHQVKKALKGDKIDLIISSVPMEEDSVTCVEVNPLLTEKDILKLNRYIKKHGRTGSTVIMDEILGAVKRHCMIMDYDGLAKELSRILNVKNIGDRKGVKKPVLKELLNQKTIKLNVEAKTWEEAVSAGGALLEMEGCIEHRYVDAMINSVKEIGPYIVIAPGIAMPHARPESGVKKIGMSLITLSEPVKFGNKENDPVDIVVCLCAIDHTTHIKALTELVGMLGNDEMVKQIRNAKEVSEVQNMILDFNSINE